MPFPQTSHRMHMLAQPRSWPMESSPAYGVVVRFGQRSRVRLASNLAISRATARRGGRGAAARARPSEARPETRAASCLQAVSRCESCRGWFSWCETGSGGKGDPSPHTVTRGKGDPSRDTGSGDPRRDADDTPLLTTEMRPYDLRHSGVTWRLNSGVPATEVAAWAGRARLFKPLACSNSRDLAILARCGPRALSVGG
jgi:hypothetical protein